MPVGRRLLSEMDLTNALVCSDALHCQRETVRTVARSNGESLVQIKDNITMPFILVFVCLFPLHTHEGEVVLSVQGK